MEAWTTTVDRTVDHESPRVEADVLMHRGFDMYYLVKFPVVFWVELFYPPPPASNPIRFQVRRYIVQEFWKFVGTLSCRLVALFRDSSSLPKDP